MRNRTIALMLLLGFVVATAATAKVNYELDETVDFSALRTYAWREHKGAEDEIIGDAIRAEVDAVLAKRGLRKIVAEGEVVPDLWVEYIVGMVDGLRAGMRAIPGWWGGAYLIPAGRSTVEAGVALVFSHAAEARPVFGGSVIMRGNNPQALQVMRDKAPKEAGKIAKKYPELKD